MDHGSPDVRRASVRRIAGAVPSSEPTGRAREANPVSAETGRPKAQIKVLEVGRRGTALQEFVREGQRESLAADGIQTQLLDVTAKAPGVLNEMLMRAMEKECPDAVLIRGGEVLSVIQPPRSFVPFYFDHCTPYEFGASSPLRTKLALMRSCFCYSNVAEEALRAAGVGRVRVVTGPRVPYIGLPLPEQLTIGGLKTSADAAQTLSSIVSMREKHERDYRIVSAIKMNGVDLLPSDIDVAEASTVLVAPTDFEDMGQPHEGAALALAFGRALITTQTSGLSQVNFPAGTFIQVVKYSANSYASAVEVFLGSNTQRKLLEWAAEDRTFADTTPGIIRKGLEK